MGYPVSFRQAMTAVSAGGLASALFFQVAGQLIARGAVMGKTGTPFANVVVITVYERVIAAVLSAVAALAGAYFIFGKIYLDPTSGSIDLIKITCGLIATAAVGAMLGYGRTAAHAIAPYMTMRFAHQLLKIMILTGLVQVPMMIAYVAISHSLSLKTPVADLVAASLVVMFAASVPISLAGWGIREMSAVAALSTIGVPSHVAFTTAILSGLDRWLPWALYCPSQCWGRSAKTRHGRQSPRRNLSITDARSGGSSHSQPRRWYCSRYTFRLALDYLTSIWLIPS